MQLSFVIPAYNEEEHIENAILSINRHVPDHLQHETIVVDHGSSDNTAELARKSGARVITSGTGTVASLRNIGASKSSGDILVFLDADVLLSDEWTDNIEAALNEISSGKRMLTGSWVCISEHPSLIEKWWFKPLEQAEVKSHMNTGHMIISKQLFDELNGFDDRYETGEDYEFSARARRSGVEIIDNRKLVTYHEGYPKSLAEFIRREYWHGRGDALSLKSMLSSKVALIAILFGVLHLLLLVSLFINSNVAIILACLLFLVTFIPSFIKFRNEPVYVIAFNCLIYYIYFWARNFSMLSTLFERDVKKRKR